MGWADKLTGMISRLEKIFKEFDKFYREVINEHLDSKRPQGEHEDILDVLLQIKKERDFKIDLTWDNIKGVLVDIFVAGTETSAASVIWAMTYLMKHPRVMKKAQEEIRDLTGKKDFVDEDDIRRFSYLEAVLKETLRLQPAKKAMEHKQQVTTQQPGKSKAKNRKIKSKEHDHTKDTNRD
ncbi:hypothetical protein Q3G72_011159 [Acer saccharum]|nr:hypothetical protein Q3G72_011159 [Acer saccharum]